MNAVSDFHVRSDTRTKFGDRAFSVAKFHPDPISYDGALGF